MFYHDAAGQLYLHLPLVPTVLVVVVLIGLLKVKILSIGLLKKRNVLESMNVSEVSERSEAEADSTTVDDKVPYEPRLHSESQVRHIDL